MLFTKVPYKANFDFVDAYDPKTGRIQIGQRALTATVRHFEGDIHHIAIRGEGLLGEDVNLTAMNAPKETSEGSLKIGKDFAIEVVGTDGEPFLVSEPGFGVMGDTHLFSFAFDRSFKAYGLGEKTFGKFDLTKQRVRYWNTDALGDFHHKQWEDSPCDPYYASVPYLILRKGDTYIGLLLHNPYPSWIDTGTDPSFFGNEDHNRRIVLGAEGGMASLWILVGPSLAELTCKLQKLVGVTPRPPLWALGYHQCRWEYKGEEHLKWLDEGMTKNQIPNDGLWLDIDYMTGYRVFTYSQEAFPRGVKPVIADLAKNGRKVVPIIDPGVKKEPGLALYEEAIKGNHVCLNPQGKPYVGFVWPGETVFPDFSQERTREWWAEKCKEFRQVGFGGAWIDMNDPSTGAVDPYAMLFSQGKYPHGAFRNQYALGMAMATRRGFELAEPNLRPFVLSRSGYIGSSSYTAIWTGDNVSNRFYLKGSIPTTIGLGLSGIPFNGPDVGGFLYSTNESLMVDWVKAGFLFPFFRNHCGSSFKRQEPWQFGKKALGTIRHYTRLRYKLLPYIYQLFVIQNEEGHPMLRPIQYHYPGGEWPDDAFLVGSDILQAPCLEEEGGRTVQLPGRKPWFDARFGTWVKGRQTITKDYEETPLYFRDGAIIPALPGERKDNAKDLRSLEVHLFLTGGAAETEFTVDDGETLDFQKGRETRVRVRASINRGTLDVTWECLTDGYGVPELEFWFYGAVSAVRVNGKRVAKRSRSIRWTGSAPLTASVFA